MEADQSDSPGDSKPLIRLTPELSKFVENMGLHYERYGVPRSGGRILGLLLLAQDPLAPEQLAEILEISRSNISTNLRMLQMSGLVEKVALPGERADYYIFASDSWEQQLRSQMESVLELQEIAQEGLASLEGEDPVRSRLEKMIDWVSLLEEVYQRVIDQWQSRNRIPA
jgi:DNA-binding transcriptional regulator GbsR (MarR family)